ncbi:MAG TPA: aminotransferase class V-fold PLP-dependent enzyme [Chitinophagaceae bacterium]
MTSGIVNLSTGPVGITTQVLNALKEPPVSHRSAEFIKLYNRTTSLLSNEFNVKQTYLLTGSGTLANEVMLQEIKHLRGKGLILSNGEFGRRLVDQSTRNNINFDKYDIAWGASFDLNEVEKKIIDSSAAWILFCHSETSTGVINKLDEISAIAKRNKCLCFVDCMSTAGTMPIDLSEVTMASASSGKGLACVPGLAIIFSNISPSLKSDSPVYLDLGYYAQTGIPFTLSSNLVKALLVSVLQKLTQSQYDLLQFYRAEIFSVLNQYNFVPFSNADSKVFTLVNAGYANNLTGQLKKKQLLLSSESEYLKTRGWTQLATFGYYTEKQLKYVLKCLAESCAN